MLTALYIAVILVCLAVIFLIFNLIDAIKSFKSLSASAQKNIQAITADINETKIRIVASLNELSVTQAKINGLIDDIAELKKDVSGSLASIDSLAKSIEQSSEGLIKKSDVLFKMLEPVEALTKAIYSSVSGPVSGGISLVSATGKAVSAFTNSLFKRKR